MNSELVLRYTQIGFYVSAILVAWLTYFSAKRTLLNSVNTEYRKRVMDRLAAVSETLLGTDIDSQKDPWEADLVTEVKDRARRINEAFLAKEDRDEIDFNDQRTVDFSLIVTGGPRSSLRLLHLARMWESDPFIPAHLRKPIVMFLVEHARAEWECADQALKEHLRLLRSSERSPDSQGMWAALHHFLDLLSIRGVQGADFGERVRVIRQNIQVYLESFDPLRKHNQSFDEFRLRT